MNCPKEKLQGNCGVPGPNCLGVCDNLELRWENFSVLLEIIIGLEGSAQTR